MRNISSFSLAFSLIRRSSLRYFLSNAGAVLISIDSVKVSKRLDASSLPFPIFFETAVNELIEPFGCLTFQLICWHRRHQETLVLFNGDYNYPFFLLERGFEQLCSGHVATVPHLPLTDNRLFVHVEVFEGFARALHDTKLRVVCKACAHSGATEDEFGKVAQLRRTTGHRDAIVDDV